VISVGSSQQVDEGSLLQLLLKTAKVKTILREIEYFKVVWFFFSDSNVPRFCLYIIA
jgi:hypothetical protein